jgi:hypothetical protein
MGDEINFVKDIVAESAGKAGRGQGYRLPSAAREAIEKHAMEKAVGYYSQRGWKVIDVSKKESYDLRCIRDGKEIQVEVKGTTTERTKVILTPNEVDHARAAYPNGVLLVVSKIHRSEGNVCYGGNVGEFNPWSIDKGRLEPVGYEYSVPDEH